MKRKVRAKLKALARAYADVHRAPPPRTYEEFREREAKRNSARQKVKQALRIGKIVRPGECEICGEDRELQAHHTDYTKPLDVVFLCVSCHASVHSLAPETHAGSGFYERYRREHRGDGRYDPVGQGVRVELPYGGSVYTIDGDPDDPGDIDAWYALAFRDLI
jgi:hypothetical protein